MQFRTFGPLDWKPSALGFGAMRLPILDDDPAKIDEPLAIRMIRTAIDRGVNYVDTAYPYHRGESERLVGKALQDGYRDRVKLATKSPSWLIKEAADFDSYLDEQLQRLGTDRIDFYLLHGLNKERWPMLRDAGVLARAEAAIADGRIGHLGFSFHDDLAAFKAIVDDYDWTFCQIMYNYMDVEFQAGREGLRYAADKGLAVIVMEPLRGGSLTRPAPQPVAELWSQAETRRSQAEWALLWVWNHPEVSLLLSGMSTMEQVEENTEVAGRSGIGLLTDAELGLVDRVRDAYRGLSPIPCTDCRYCLPCPNGVAIPRIFAMYNTAMMYGDHDRARQGYTHQMNEAEHADHCVECGQCESACPQQIRIIDWLKKSHRFLTATE